MRFSPYSLVESYQIKTKIYNLGHFNQKKFSREQE